MRFNGEGKQNLVAYTPILTAVQFLLLHPVSSLMPVLWHSIGDHMRTGFYPCDVLDMRRCRAFSVCASSYRLVFQPINQTTSLFLKGMQRGICPLAKCGVWEKTISFVSPPPACIKHQAKIITQITILAYPFQNIKQGLNLWKK